MYNQLLREQVYFRGKLVIKASHWAIYLEGTLVNMKNVVGNFVTRTGTIHGGLKHVTYNISMEIVFIPSYMSIFHHQIVRIVLLLHCTHF